jgi:DNA-binding NtrC family response regulator
LLFRLNTIVIRVPPLRERREDIPLLAGHYLKLYELQYQRPVRNVAVTAMAALVRHEWPGNVRALRHACERAVILGQGAEYGLADFALGTAVASSAPAVVASLPAPAAGAAPNDMTLDALEREAIATTLAQFNGNISHAAKTLGISRAALYRKLGKHGI